jgi:uncharacterized SAM-binding protein YcdF (DUF218 family)
MRALRLAGRLVLALVATWLCVSVVLAGLVVYTGTVDSAVRSDVIVVLGAALNRDGTPYRALTRRAEHAASLWSRGMAARVICTGGIGAHVQVPRSEADGCREVLMRHGVPRTAIVLEESSRTTAGNAREAQQVMQRHGWRRAIVVSDSYHVLRARYLFVRAGVDVVTSPVPAVQVGSPLFYVMSVVREVAALQWQMVG